MAVDVVAQRRDRAQGSLPDTRRLLMHGEGHNAERRAPDRLAEAIAKFIDEDLQPANPDE
jgi:hypothetical protein